MALQPGSRVGHYEIVSALGAGGMGEVYQARDAQLGRDVAIKVLPDVIAADPDRIARFQREAQLLASVNHPHIAAIYGIAESDGVRGLVLELVEGPTLAERIASAPLDLDEALDIASQIAEALEAAHERGVIHRDLKPANIKVTPGGRVKVLDFGLAKMVHGESAASSLSLSPTFSMHATLAGVLLGTAAYMSPEQARGKAVDRRTDIWSFGCVLFEMLTGRRVFATGETVSDVVAAILRSDPDWSRLPATTPPGIRRLLRRCLAKDPRERLHDIADARLEIRDARTGNEPAAEVPSSARRNRLAWTIVAVLGALSAALAWTLVRSSTRPPAELAVYRSTILPPPQSTFANFGGRIALSPDGRSLAFVAPATDGRDMLWVRRLDTGNERVLAGTDGAASPFWSPDSRHLAFVVDGMLKRVEAGGGPVLTLGEGAGLSGGTWNQDDIILFAPQTPGPIQRIAASGGPATPATTLDPGGRERGHIAPVFLPDGRRFLYRLQVSDPTAPRNFVERGAGGIHVGSLDSQERRQVLDRANTTMYAGGFLVFMRGTTLMAQPFDVERLTVTGDGTPIVEEVQIGAPPAFTGAFSASQSGVLVYQAGAAPLSQLMWLDRTGKEFGALSEHGGYGYIQLSPDDRHVAVSMLDSTTSRNRDVWLYDVARRVRTRFTTEPADEFAAVWAPDLSRLVFATGGGGGLDLFEKALAGRDKAQVLTHTPDVSEIPGSWSSDGRFLLYWTPSPLNDLFILPMTGDRKAVPFATTRFSELAGQFSPDGRWVAFTSNETGRPEIYVAPFGRAGGKVPVSTGGGEFARWRRDGLELFYLAPDSRLMSVPVRGREGVFDVGTPQPLFEVRLGRATGGAPYAVTADGQRFLVNTPAKNAVSLPLTLVVNWPTALKKSS